MTPDEVPDCFRTLTDEELASVVPPTDEEIKEALDRGRRDAEAFRRSCGMLPGRYV